MYCYLYELTRYLLSVLDKYKTTHSNGNIKIFTYSLRCRCILYYRHSINDILILSCIFHCGVSKLYPSIFFSYIHVYTPVCKMMKLTTFFQEASFFLLSLSLFAILEITMLPIISFP